LPVEVISEPLRQATAATVLHTLGSRLH
jgi:hypothetical protein